MGNTYIKQLHGKEIYRQFLLLDYLYSSLEGEDMAFLKEKFACNRRTIAKYIETINMASETLFNQESIQLVKNRTYVFIGDKQDVYSLKLFLLEDSPGLILARKFLSTSRVVFDRFCEEYYVGETTLRRRLHVANSLLRAFNLQIKVRKNEIVLSGEERVIRHALIAFFWRTYRGIEWPFLDLDKQEVLQKFDEIIGEGQGKISEQKQEEVLYILAINYLRSQSGHPIEYRSMLSQFDPLLHENPIFLRLLNTFLPLYPNTVSEIKFLFLFLMCLPEFYFYTSPWTILENLKGVADEVYENSQHFFYFIKQRHPEWKLEDEKNRKFLSVLLSGLMNLSLFNGHSFSISNISLQKQMEKEFPSLLPSIQTFVRMYHLEEKEEQINRLTMIYTRAYIMIYPPHDFEEEIKIGINSDMPLYVEKYIRHVLGHILSAKFKTHFYTNEEAEVDMILSTSPMQVSTVSVPQIVIDASVSEKDIQTVYDACWKIMNERK